MKPMKIVKKIPPVVIVLFFMAVVYVYAIGWDYWGNWRYAFYPVWLAVGWISGEFKWGD